MLNNFKNNLYFHRQNHHRNRGIFLEFPMGNNNSSLSEYSTYRIRFTYML